jgi:hypothetical protein
MLGDDLAKQVTDAVALVAPIQGISIGTANDKTTWRIDFKPEATSAQRIAAQSVLDNFVPDPPAIRQTKWIVGLPSKQPAGWTEIASGKFVPYYD